MHDCLNIGTDARTGRGILGSGASTFGELGAFAGAVVAEVRRSRPRVRRAVPEADRRRRDGDGAPLEGAGRRPAGRERVAGVRAQAVRHERSPGGDTQQLGAPAPRRQRVRALPRLDRRRRRARVEPHDRRQVNHTDRSHFAPQCQGRF